ncbi:hypothetical protein AVEN_204502-1 [Araneus ventricosus]|uniref:Uncharacterized protein n=1 Tax=Araneus ventricosus TaxID=182803 RepID=A0A4Y2ST45_ARAVE|nr:hypothetical protein AVEN_204502-1 [Araneus ventricosus]
MTRVEPFGKVAERFASQQERRFSVRFLVRFPQAFITSLFQAFQKAVKSPPSADKIDPPSPLRSRRVQPPFFGKNKHFFTPLQSRTPTNFKFLRAGDRTRVHRVGKQTQ